jgi:peptide/nickel transport system permease protein
MLRYVLRRVGLMGPILLGMVTITFAMTKAVPVDPVLASLNQGAANHPAIVAAYRAKWGLNRPVVEQYFIYLWNLLHGNLGVSIYTHRPVATDLSTYFPATIELATTAILISVVLSFPLGILAAMRRGGVTDVVIRVLTLVGSAMPIFWLGLFLLNVLYDHLHVVPAPARLSITGIPPPTVTGMYTVDSLLTGNFGTFWDAFTHLLFPAFVLATWSLGLLTRMTRSSMLSVLPQDFLRAVRGRGGSSLYVIRRHAAPNAMIPVVTLVGLAYGDLLSGAVVVETIFNWPGIGLYAYHAAVYADFPAIIGVTLLVGLTYMVLNLIVDVVYAALDPRVRSSLVGAPA